MFCLSYKNHDFLAIFSEFAKKCSNEYIFVFPLANLVFRGYVRGGRWVGEVSQNNVCVREEGRRQKDWCCGQCQSVRHYECEELLHRVFEKRV